MKIAVLLAAIVLLCFNLDPWNPFPRQSLAVPSYFEPGSQWTQMQNAYPTVRTIVANPRNGPGDYRSDYVEHIDESQAAGLNVLGYVHTGYGSRSIAEVKAEIDNYYSWYGVDGIFLDEASTDCQDAQDYYLDLYRYIKGKDGKTKVVVNPGMPTEECYMEVANIVVTFEGSYDSYVNNYSTPSWVGDYSPRRFWHLVHSAPTITEMERAVRLSKDRNAGWVYVTPDTLSNPWDTLPPDVYWSRELSMVRSGY